MLLDYAAVLMFFLISFIGFFGAIVGSHFLGKYHYKKANIAKQLPYECGNDPFKNTNESSPIKYYRIALFFLIFEGEMVFLFPFAMVIRQLDKSAIIGVIIFLVLLGLGLVYEWKKGALAWD